MTKKQDVGGQAVIEGVMMRNKLNVVTAVRKKGKIVYKKDKLKKKSKFAQLFFIRGIVNLVEMLTIGIKTLNWSASQATGEEEDLSNWAITLTLIAAFVIGIGLFILLPYVLTYLFGVRETSNPLWFNVIDGMIKITILVLYMYLISLMKDIRTVFKYHGAEHKAVFCYEDGKKLTVENAKKYSTKHPRCGTSFLIIVVVVSVFIFSFIPLIVKGIYPSIESVGWLLRRVILFVVRISLLPIVAGFSYETLKFSAKFHKNPIFRTLTLPGLWVQKITTKEPSKKQLEVAIAALKKVI